MSDHSAFEITLLITLSSVLSTILKIAGWFRMKTFV